MSRKENTGSWSGEDDLFLPSNLSKKSAIKAPSDRHAGTFGSAFSLACVRPDVPERGVRV